MEVEENDNEILKRLFLKRFGRALPEADSVDDINMDLIDLTKEPDDEMEVATPIEVIIKTEPIEITESDRAEANSVEQVNPVGNVYERKDMTDAEMEAEQREFNAEFGHIEEGNNVNETDEFDNIDIEPLC
jgi:hypothetical protein